MTANSRISNLINSQVPFFVKNDHQKFVTFIQKYYEFLEQTDGVLDVKDNIVSFNDIDYVTRNNRQTITYQFPTSLINTAAVQNNANTGKMGIPYIVLGMSVSTPNTNYTGVDRALYDFLATGASNTANLADSYADITRNKIVSSTDAGQWLSYTVNGTTGNAARDLFAANVVAEMISTQNTYPGYFSRDLFNYTTVTANSSTSATSLEIQLQEKLYDTFLKLFPKDMRVDKTLLLKHAKEFYLSRGSEKSIRFLMNILFGQENISFYYPKTDVLKASDGKWYIQKSLKINSTKINGASNNSIFGLEKFVNTSVKGNTSGATATVERIDRFYEGGTLVDEIVISNIRGTFTNGEEIFTLFNNSDYTVGTASANIFGGILNTVTVVNPGANYNVGDPVIIESSSGSGANVQVARVSSGNIASISVLQGGAGYQNNNSLLITGGGGSGANGYISLVQPDGAIHPNTYNIYYTQIYLEENTPINNTIYSNLVSSITDPANNWIANSLSSFVYANTGPAKTIVITNPGSGFTSKPSISVLANTRIKELGVLGRMKINNGGVGYQIGDTIQITNVPGGYGTGAAGNVTNVAANGMITGVYFKEVPGHIIGGAGYSTDSLPTASVISANGSAYGANISVVDILGTGGEYIIANTTLGAIERLIIIDKGSGYLTAPTMNLTQIGDGTATANATIIEGVYSYPGRYLNDDGMLSTYNFLQDRDYYQNFSYVIKLQASVESYRQALKNLIHPAGMKMFGSYVYDNNNESYNVFATATDVGRSSTKSKTYVKTGNTINIAYASHGLSVNSNVGLTFISGGSKNVKNGIYTVTSTNTNHFLVVQPRSGISSISIINPGALYNSNSFIVFSSENGKTANASYTVNTNGSIVSVKLLDYGAYYSTTPIATANGSNSVPATFAVTLNHYANNTSGTVNVSTLLS